VLDAQRAAAGTHLRVLALGRLDGLARGAAAHRHVADVFAALVVGRHLGQDPVVVAVLAPVLDHAHPRPAGLERAPQVGERLRRHVGVADDVVRLADEFGLGVAADLHELGIRVHDHAAQVGA
jgi:hypothetical protein